MRLKPFVPTALALGLILLMVLVSACGSVTSTPTAVEDAAATAAVGPTYS